MELACNQTKNNENMIDNYILTFDFVHFPNLEIGASL